MYIMMYITLIYRSAQLLLRVTVNPSKQCAHVQVSSEILFVMDLTKAVDKITMVI